MPNAKLIVGVQNQPAFWLGQCFGGHNVRSDMHFLPGSHFFAHGSVALFVSKTLQQVEDQIIQNNVVNDLGWTEAEAAAYTGIVVLDIEHNVHPKDIDLHEANLTSQEYSDLLDQWAICVQATANVFSSAQIGWYGIPEPFRNGQPVSQAKIDAWAEMFATRDFSDLDFVLPVIYPGWGPEDFEDSHTGTFGADCNGYTYSCPMMGCPNPPTMLKTRYETIAENGMDAILEVLDDAANWTPTPSYSVGDIEIIPLLTFLTYNGSSCHHDDIGNAYENKRWVVDSRFDPTLESTLKAQLDVFYGTYELDHVAIWGWPTILCDHLSGTSIQDPTGHYFHINDYLDVLACKGDFDGDGDVDNFDQLDFQDHFVAGCPCADLNHDGTLDMDDYDEMQAAAAAGCP